MVPEAVSLLLACAALSSVAHGAADTWATTGGVAVNGNWSTAANWNSGAGPVPSTGDDITFTDNGTSATTYTSTVDSAWSGISGGAGSVHSLTFGLGSSIGGTTGVRYALNLGSGVNTLNIGAGGITDSLSSSSTSALTIQGTTLGANSITTTQSLGLSANQTWADNAAGAFVVDLALSGSGSVTKTGGGSLNFANSTNSSGLTGTSTSSSNGAWTGNFNLQGGIVTMGSGNGNVISVGGSTTDFAFLQLGGVTGANQNTTNVITIQPGSATTTATTGFVYVEQPSLTNPIGGTDPTATTTLEVYNPFVFAGTPTVNTSTIQDLLVQASTPNTLLVMSGNFSGAVAGKGIQFGIGGNSTLYTPNIGNEITGNNSSLIVSSSTGITTGHNVGAVTVRFGNLYLDNANALGVGNAFPNASSAASQIGVGTGAGGAAAPVGSYAGLYTMGFNVGANLWANNNSSTGYTINTFFGNTTGSATFSGSLTMERNATTNTIRNPNVHLNAASGASATFSGLVADDITGAFSFDKVIADGGGTVSLTRSNGNTYAGGTIVIGNTTLTVGNTLSSSSATGTGAVTLGAAAQAISASAFTGSTSTFTVGSTTGLAVGEAVSGTGIPAGTYITAINPDGLTNVIQLDIPVSTSQNASTSSSIVGGKVTVKVPYDAVITVGDAVSGGTGIAGGTTITSIAYSGGFETLTLSATSGSFSSGSAVAVTLPSTTPTLTGVASTGSLNGTGFVSGPVTLNNGTISGSVTMSSSVTANGGTVKGSVKIGNAGAAGSTALTLNSGANLAGSVTVLGDAVVNAGGSIDMSGDGALTTINLNGSGKSLSLGGSAGNPSTIGFDVSGTSSDQIILNNTGGSLYIGAGGVIVNINAITKLTGNGTDGSGNTTPLLIVNGPNGNNGLAAGSAAISYLTFTIGTTTGNFNGYNVSIGTDAFSDVILLEQANATPTTAYFNGAAAAVTAQGGTTAFNSFVNGNTNTSNFSSNAAGTVNDNGLIGSTTNVYLDAGNITSAQSVSLGQNFTINSLNFTGSNTVGTPVATTIAAGNTLTLNASAGYTDGQSTPVTYAAGTGIVVQPGAAASTINANIALGNSQTWEIDNSASNPLTIGGVISGASKALTKTGTGKLVFAGTSANTYNGLTQVNAGELDLNDSGGVAVAGALTVGPGTGSASTVKLLASNQVATTSAVTLNSDGTLALNGFSNTVASLTSTGGTITGGGTLTSTAAPVFNGTSATSTIGSGATVASSNQATLAAGDSLTLNGTLSDSAGLSLAGGATTLSGSGSVSGAVTLNGSNLVSGTGAGLSTGGMVVNSTGNNISSGTVGGNITFNGSSGTPAALNVAGIASGTVNVSTYATLSGTGATGAVTLGGTSSGINLVKANSTTGTLTVGGLTTTGGGTLTFAIGTSSGAIDNINDTGTLVLGGTTNIVITNLNNSGSQSIVNGSGTTYLLLASTGVSGAGSLNLTTTTLDGHLLSLSQSGNNYYLTVAPNVTGTSFTLATSATSTLLHAGASTTLTTTLTNTGTGSADSIDYSGVGASTTLGTITPGTTINGNLANGNTSVSNTSNTLTTTAGTSGTATISSNGTLTNHTVGGTPAGTPTGTTITVYSGFATWTGTGSTGSWGATPTATPANWTAAGGTPGVTTGFTGVDTATFGAVSGGTTPTTVTLDGANPNLNAINFTTATRSYTIAQGTGGSITLSGTTPSINVTAGSHTISAPVILGANTALAASSGTKLTLSGAISGGSALSNTGAGTTILSANSTYTGGTTISNGNVYINNAGGASYAAPSSSAQRPITATNSTGSGTGTGSVTVASGATLGGSGTIASTSGGVTVQSGGVLASGALQTDVAHGGTGSVVATGLTINNSANLSSALVINGGATLTFALGSSTAYNGGSGALNFADPNTNSTYLSIGGNTADQIFSNTSTAHTINLIDVTNGAAPGGVSLTLRAQNPYLLIQTALGDNSDFSNLWTTGGEGQNGFVLGVSTGLGSNYTAFNLNAVDINGNMIGASTNLQNLQLYLYNGDLEVVPEPGTWVLMIGGLALLVCVQRSRRNRHD